MGWFGKRISPDQRAEEWVALMNQGLKWKLLEEIDRHPKVISQTSVPLLHVSILANQAEVLEALLQHGADPNKPDRYGQHPVFLAVGLTADISLLECLIRLKVKIDQTDRYGSSPLMYAVRNELLFHTKILLTAGADPNHRDNEGDTVLMYAMGTDKITLISTLLQSGANPGMLNFDGLSAFDKTRNQEILELMSRK